jgi:hypothetical protein
VRSVHHNKGIIKSIIVFGRFRSEGREMKKVIAGITMILAVTFVAGTGFARGHGGHGGGRHGHGGGYHHRHAGVVYRPYYGYSGYRGYYGPAYYYPQVWVPGYWEDRCTPEYCERVWVPGYWRE